MTASTRPCCVKIPKLLEVTEVRRKNTEIFSSYQRSKCFDARKIITKANCRECGNLITCPNLESKIMRQQLNNTLNWEEIFVYILILASLLLIVMSVYFVRQYNQAFVFGTGGCTSSFMWTHHDCPVLV